MTNYLQLARDSYEIEAVLDILSYSFTVLNQCRAVVIQIIIDSIQCLCIIIQSLLSNHNIHHHHHQHHHHNDLDINYQASKCQQLKNNADRNIQLVYEIFHTMSSRVSMKIKEQLQYTILLLYPFTSLQLRSQKQWRDNHNNNNKLVTSSTTATTTATTTTSTTSTSIATVGNNAVGRMNTNINMPLGEGSSSVVGGGGGREGGGKIIGESVIIGQMDFNDVYEQLKKKWGQKSLHRIELTKRYRCYLSTNASTTTATTTNNNKNSKNNNNATATTSSATNNTTCIATNQTDTATIEPEFAIFVPQNDDINCDEINNASQQTMVMTSLNYDDNIDMNYDDDEDNDSNDDDIHITNSSHENNQIVNDKYLQSFVHTSSSSSSINSLTALTTTKRRKTIVIPRHVDDDLIATNNNNNNNNNNDDVMRGVDDKHEQQPSKLARVNLVNSLFSILD